MESAIMEITQQESEKLEQFKKLFGVDSLTTDQIKFILGRDPHSQLHADSIQQQDPKSPSQLSSDSKKQPSIYSLRRLFKSPQRISPKPRFDWKAIAKHAAKKGERYQSRKQDNSYRIAKLFRNNEKDYRIEKINEYYVHKYRTTRSEWKVYGSVDIFQMHDVISELVNRMTHGLQDNVKLKVSLENTKNDRVNQSKLLSKQDMIYKLSDWVNFFIDYHDMNMEDITFKLLAIEIPTGAGRVNKIITAESKRSIIQVKNYDTICLARSIVVALAVHNKEILQSIFKDKLTEAELKEINKGRQTKNFTQINNGILSDNEKSYLIHGRKLQTVLAKALHIIYNISIKPGGNDFEDVKLFEERLGIEIQMFNLESRQIYKGTDKPVKVYILMSENHFDVISNIDGFKCVNDRNEKAKLKCKACKAPAKCSVNESQVTCDKCNKYFYGKTCYNNHITNKKCKEHSYKCPKCHRFYKTRDLKQEDHKCDEVKCGNCKKYVPMDHECYMLKKDLKTPSEKYIFYDFETKLDPTTKKHIVNYGIAQYFNGEERIFNNLDEFCKWAFDKSKHGGYTLIAHYGKGYDFQFVAEWLIAHGIKPRIIHNGQKILQLEVKQDYNIRFVDSISFTLMPLRDFPKTFGLTELAKGYFPHKFNTDENQNYIGSYPGKEFYGYDELTKKNREEFDKWYATTANKVFNFRKEMEAYCRSDVDILRRGCTEFRKLFMQIANVDPFQYVTIASVCQAIYRSQFLPQNTISICSETPTDNYSIKSIKWLKYISQKENVNIRHACNGGEQGFRLDGHFYKVDGYCKETNTIYQFHGCYFHGCRRCYDELTVNKVSQHNMKYLYNRTNAIDELIKTSGYNLVTIWEHEFESNKDMKGIKLDEYDLVEQPKFREDGFFGGRCEPVKLLHNFKEKQEKGKYIDVVSLYPTVMFYDRYPTGHPTRISKPTDYKHNWFGFIHCRVLPPRGLYIPVLPYKQKTKQTHKLLFGLCRTCMARLAAKCEHFSRNDVSKMKCFAECNTPQCQKCKNVRKIAKQNCQQCHQLRNSDCQHSDNERAITGLWTTAEMQKALDKGYKIDKIYDVWHFEQSSTDLWKGYIRKFMKIKLETSKFTCSEEEYRLKARNFGIELGDLKENPGLRFISKICLNSLWGKFGQNPKVKHSEYIDTERDFYRVILDDKIEQISLCFLNDNMIYASYERKDEFLKTSYNTNIYIACFTSSWARLRLYNMLEKLDKNVCYCDTDSVVYIENEQTKAIVDQCIGDGLGDWTDELGGNHMEFWCCAQAKDYGYILDNGKQAGKVKGFRVNAETEEKMTNEQRIKLIKGAINHIDVNYNQFTIKNCEIITKHMVKQWAFKFDKRMIRTLSEDEIDTLPYGY